jgi:hypothetical protein
VEAVKAAGFTIEEVIPTRSAEVSYLQALRPKLRRAAHERAADELRVIEFALLAKKP